MVEHVLRWISNSPFLLRMLTHQRGDAHAWLRCTCLWRSPGQYVALHTNNNLGSHNTYLPQYSPSLTISLHCTT